MGYTLFGSSGGQNDHFRPLIYTLGGEGHGVQGQICDILRPQLAMNRFLPLWPHRFPHFGYIHLGKGGCGGALIIDRCQAFDLFASVDAHLCLVVMIDVVYLAYLLIMDLYDRCSSYIITLCSFPLSILSSLSGPPSCGAIVSTFIKSSTRN
jgi:hypothetical protein